MAALAACPAPPAELKAAIWLSKARDWRSELKVEADG